MTRHFLRGLAISGVWALSACASLPKLAITPDALTAPEHVALGNVYETRHEKKLAVQQYKAALDQDRHSVPALMALGNIAFENRQWGKARSFFRKALKQAPNDPGILNNLAMVDVGEGRHLDRARQIVQKALPAAGSLKPYLLDTLAHIALREGRFAEAQESLNQAAASAPQDNPEFNQHLTESRQSLAAAMK